MSLRVVEPRDLPRTMGIDYFAGLDLGQAQDYSALAVLERKGKEKETWVYTCRHLQRWPLRTSYRKIVDDAVTMMNSKQIQCGRGKPVLAVDGTGLGAPVVDLFRTAHLWGFLEPIVITGGNDVTRDDSGTKVPKRDLVSCVQVLLQSDRLKIVPSLPDAELLTRELSQFQVKINLETAHDSYGAWREGAHDDLVLALALGLWAAENVVDRTVFVIPARDFRRR